MTSKRWWIAVQLTFLGYVLWKFGVKVVDNWSELGVLRTRLHPVWWRVAATGVPVLLSYAVLIETWRRTLRTWGARLPWSAAAQIWFVSNLGKYMPGKLWQVAAMATLAQRHGVSPIAAVGSSLVVNLVNIVAGFALVALFGSARLAGAGFWPGLAVAALLIAGMPWLLPRALRLAARLTKRDFPAVHIPMSALVLAFVGCSLAWMLYGYAFGSLAVAIFGLAAGTTALYTAVFTLSYLLGYVAVFAPGGIGVREKSLTSLLAVAGLESGPNATLLVIASRLWLTVLETVPGLLLLLNARRSRVPTEPIQLNGSETDGPVIG